MKTFPKNTYRFPFFKLAIRLSAYLSAGVAVLLIIAGVFFLPLPALSLILLVIGIGLATFVLTYLATRYLLYKRLQYIDRITRNIIRKKFDEYENIHTGHDDELDYLVTQSLRASKTVEREIQRLNKIENYRKEFIGDISHELKTPIFAIQGFIETLLDGALEDKEVNRTFLSKAMKNVNRLIYLTKDLMEISKLETGELKSEIMEINLRNVILDVIENLQYKAQKENVNIRLNDFDKNLIVRADRNQLKQILINLIENGMKYNKPDGFVEVGLQTYSQDEEKVLLYVKDSGIGIDPQNLERVTERFYRVDKSRSRDKGGTGLGLSIVKHIIEAHGEKLFIESEPGKGSTFSFTLTKLR